LPAFADFPISMTLEMTLGPTPTEGCRFDLFGNDYPGHRSNLSLEALVSDESNAFGTFIDRRNGL
jgi:hypothetical protein